MMQSQTPQMKGTHLNVRFSRVVDGDTVRVFLPGADQDESLRLLSLDTEESSGGGRKPVTPWGRAATERAKAFFARATTVTIEFPGTEDLATALQKYRGNYGRLLVYIYADGVDFQETMIREGYSPYFVKYGNAEFAGHHQRYIRAEREAQRQRLGIWDQIAVNGSVLRDYATLGVWWQLRADLIEEYRHLRAKDESLLNPRLDYAKVLAQAQAGERATVFTELRSLSRVGGRSGLIGIGSSQQPFSLFIPDLDSESGQAIANLVQQRYASSGEDQPRRSYAYVSGELSLFGDRPQMILNSTEQIRDRFELRADPGLAIVALLPNPAGADAGQETVTLQNLGQDTVNLEGWRLEDRSGRWVALEGAIAPNQRQDIPLEAGQMPLNNSGDSVLLRDPEGKVQHRVSYSAADVKTGQSIQFGPPSETPQPRSMGFL